MLWDGPLVWEQHLKKLHLSSLGLQRVNSPSISSQYCALQTYSGISVNDTVKTIVSDKRPSSAMSVKEMGNIDCLNVKKLLTLLNFLSKDTPVINKQSGSAILDES